jgi:hypothetical protein
VWQRLAVKEMATLATAVAVAVAAVMVETAFLVALAVEMMRLIQCR